MIVFAPNINAAFYSRAFLPFGIGFSDVVPFDLGNISGVFVRCFYDFVIGTTDSASFSFSTILVESAADYSLSFVKRNIVVS